jgi:hypothetical protein
MELWDSQLERPHVYRQDKILSNKNNSIFGIAGGIIVTEKHQPKLHLKASNE